MNTLDPPINDREAAQLRRAARRVQQKVEHQRMTERLKGQVDRLFQAELDDDPLIVGVSIHFEGREIIVDGVQTHQPLKLRERRRRWLEQEARQEHRDRKEEERRRRGQQRKKEAVQDWLDSGALDDLPKPLEHILFVAFKRARQSLPSNDAIQLLADALPHPHDDPDA